MDIDLKIIEGVRNKDADAKKELISLTREYLVQTIYKHRGESCPEVPVDNYMTQGWAITAEQLKARCRK